MSHSTAFANRVVKYISQATDIALVSANLQVNYHTSDPGVGGNALTAAPTWVGYAPVLVPRDAGGFTVCNPTAPYAANPATGTAFKNTSEVTFPECTGGEPEQMTWTSLSEPGSNVIVAKGELDGGGILVSPGNTARYPAGTLIYKLV